MLTVLYMFTLLFHWFPCTCFVMVISNFGKKVLILLSTGTVTEKIIIKKATMYTQDSKFWMHIQGH